MSPAPRIAAMTLGELLGAEAGRLHAVPIRDLVIDSRDADAGSAFVAIRGTREHGLKHAADALARGAEVVLYDPAETTEALHPVALGGAVESRSVAVPRLAARLGELARRLYGPAMAHVALAGVTGTNGKTTVAYLAAQAMTRLERPCGYVGTIGHGVPPAIAPHALTTPDTFTLHRELAAIADADAEHAVLEVSSHALAQDRIAGLSIGTAAFTNLTRDHLDAHGDLERYGDAKARLFALDGLRHAVLNASDAFAARLANRLAPGVRPIRVAVTGTSRRRFGFPPSAAGDRSPRRAADGGDDTQDGAEIEVRARSLGLDGLELEIGGTFGRATLRSRLIGAFNAENLAVALGILAAWNVPLAEACRALAEAVPPPGRLEVVRGRDTNAPVVVVDYAHTPDALERVLDTLREAATGELWCVFGCGGERDRGKRAPMGAAAASRADHLVVTDDNPRGEDPEEIVRDILAGTGGHPSVVVEHDRGAAIAYAVRNARAGDVVLIAGKGHETTQRIGAVERPFSDRDAAFAALEGRA
ncbi:MAG: UDP-N-acetylmuramoyl-L-alanyl-D-glutamate--2,6-diaminopimelate ligase [Gammaproteobacteria bacterium]